MSGFRATLVALSAAALTAACAAGQYAATTEENPSLDAARGQVGSIQLQGVAVHAPLKTSYAAGADVPVTVYIANNGQTSDILTKVASPAFPGGWDVVATGAVNTQPASTTPTSTPSSSASPAAGQPQPINAGAAFGLSQTKLTPDGAGSKQTLILKGLAANFAPLHPGAAVPITFTFANAGETTLSVPVQVTEKANTQTLPGGSGPSD